MGIIPLKKRGRGCSFPLGERSGLAQAGAPISGGLCGIVGKAVLVAIGSVPKQGTVEQYLLSVQNAVYNAVKGAVR
jgi:hypothetical protein